MRINVGDRVRDRISGFSGIVICRSEWLYGCIRITVQPEKTKEGGDPQDAVTFDEPQLWVVDAGVVALPPAENAEGESPRVATGGPAREGSGFTRPDAR